MKRNCYFIWQFSASNGEATGTTGTRPALFISSHRIPTSSNESTVNISCASSVDTFRSLLSAALISLLVACLDSILFIRVGGGERQTKHELNA